MGLRSSPVVGLGVGPEVGPVVGPGVGPGLGRSTDSCRPLRYS